MTNYKLQGGTFDKLIISVHSKPFPPHIDLEALYVFVSRVRKLSNLRVLHKGDLQNLLTLRHPPEMRIWDKGYDKQGDWSVSRARAVAAADRAKAGSAEPEKRKQKQTTYFQTKEGKQRVAAKRAAASSTVGLTQPQKRQHVSDAPGVGPSSLPLPHVEDRDLDYENWIWGLDCDDCEDFHG